MHRSTVLCQLLATALTFVLATAVFAGWPNFHGEGYAGRADDTPIANAWPEQGPPLLWSRSVGPGFGGVAMVDGHAYFLDRVMGEADVLRVLDLETGKEVWNAQYSAPGRLAYNGSRSVPTVTDRLVFTCGGFGHAACFDRETKKLRWKVNLSEKYDAEPPRFGYAQHPQVYGNLVIYAPFGPGVGVVALNKETGDEVWRTGPLHSGSSSPIIRNVAGVDQVIVISSSTQGSLSKDGTFYISSFEPKTGNLLWQYEDFILSNPVPVAIVASENELLVTGGYEAGTLMLNVHHDGDSFTVTRKFHVPRGAQIHTPIHDGEHFYLIVNENGNLSRTRLHEGGLMCLRKDGKVMWRTGAEPNFGRGGMVYADGKLIVQDGNNGELYLLNANPQRYEELARFSAFESRGRRDERMWAPPAMSGGLLVVRSQDTMKCFDLK